LIWHSARHFLPQQGIGSAAKAFCGDLGFRVASRAMELMETTATSRRTSAEKRCETCG
jgi:hypothetical protein